MKRVPNILSLLRILLAPIFVVLYLQESFLWAVLGMAVFIFAAVTDYLDGYYARRLKASSGFGTFLDPLADKFLTFAGFICIPFIDASQFPWWIIGIIVLRDIVITLMRIWMDQNGHSLQTRFTAKVKTFVQMVFLYVVLIIGILVKVDGIPGRISQAWLESGILGWVFLFVAIITVYTAFEYVYLNRRLFLGGFKEI